MSRAAADSTEHRDKDRMKSAKVGNAEPSQCRTSDCVTSKTPPPVFICDAKVAKAKAAKVPPVSTHTQHNADNVTMPSESADETQTARAPRKFLDMWRREPCMQNLNHACKT